jgi:F-type H+-transporting ATPase subunit delta
MSAELMARRYGSALADVVLKTSEADAVKAELAMFEQMVAGSDDLASLFTNPAVTHANKEKVLDELIRRSKPSKTTGNFLRVLLQNGRLGDLVQINDKFESELESRSGLISAQIISARDLPEAERSEFEKTIEKLTGKKVRVEYSIDPELIGGAVTRIGSIVYDGSVRTKLENLREQLANA